jgi:hypothetical protein
VHHSGHRFKPLTLLTNPPATVLAAVAGGRGGRDLVLAAYRDAIARFALITATR